VQTVVYGLILRTMAQRSAVHRDAADRHQQAAENHDRAARFWDGQGDVERAELQRDMAAYERHGAKLESAWAELRERERAERAASAVERMLSLTREHASRLSSILDQSAEELERTALLAEAHAQRSEEAGRDDAAKERRAADRAHECARRARSQAKEWLELATRSNQ
jgi:hypothetical protein